LNGRGDEQSVNCSMHVVQQLQRLGLQATNDVLLAPQERMTMQTAETPPLVGTLSVESVKYS